MRRARLMGLGCVFVVTGALLLSLESTRRQQQQTKAFSRVWTVFPWPGPVLMNRTAREEDRVA